MQRLFYANCVKPLFFAQASERTATRRKVKVKEETAPLLSDETSKGQLTVFKAVYFCQVKPPKNKYFGRKICYTCIHFIF